MRSVATRRIALSHDLARPLASLELPPKVPRSVMVPPFRRAACELKLLLSLAPTICPDELMAEAELKDPLGVYLTHEIFAFSTHLVVEPC